MVRYLNYINEPFVFDTSKICVRISHLHLEIFQPSLIRSIKLNLLQQTYEAEYFETYKPQCPTENPYTTVENLKEEIRCQDEQIERFVQQDANIAIYKERIRVLEELTKMRVES